MVNMLVHVLVVGVWVFGQAGRPSGENVGFRILPDPSRPAVQAGTVAHWCFEGQAGSVAKAEPSITDLTGRFVAVIFGEPMFRAVEGRGGLEFNGGDDRIFVIDDPALVLVEGMTLEAVIRYDGPAPESFEHQIVFRGDDRGALDPWCLYVTPEGRLLFHISDEEGRVAEVVSPTPLPGRLMSVAGTLDAGTGEMRLYVDRKLVEATVTKIRPFAKLDQAAQPGVGIGNVQSVNYKEAFNGLISEVRISDRPLRPDQLLTAKPPTTRAKLAERSQSRMLLRGFSFER